MNFWCLTQPNFWCESSGMDLHLYLSQERGRATALAKALGVSESLVAQWARGKPVTVVRCIQIEAATNGFVTRAELRPADWRAIWPELVPLHEQLAKVAA